MCATASSDSRPDAVLAGAIAAPSPRPLPQRPPTVARASVQHGQLGDANAQRIPYISPGRNQVVDCRVRPAGDRWPRAHLRSYFTANPTEYHELRGILAPIGDTQRQCNVACCLPGLSTAYDQFMAG